MSLVATPQRETPEASTPPWVVVAGVVLTIVLSRAFEGAMPVCVAALVTGLAASRYSPGVRAALAATAGLAVLFLVRAWPSPPVGDAEIVETPHLLSWLFGIPLAGAVFLLFMPRQSPKLLQMGTLVLMTVTFILSLLLLRVPMDRTFHFNEDVAWLPRFGIRYHVAIDGISLWLVVLTTFITPLAAYVSFGSIHQRMKDWCVALLLLEAGMVGAFVALDLFLFYLFWELMLIPMVLMIGVWGGSRRIYSAVKFFLYTMFGSVLMLGAVLYTAYTYSKLTGTWSFDYFELQRILYPRNTQLWLWGAFALAFVIKVPMFPFHTWLPDAHTEAPTAGSILLAAVMLKLGTYGYLRFCMGMFPEACAEPAATLAGVAVVGGIFYGALCALKQDDIKKLVAYSSVAHLGYVMLGLFACTQASLEGALLQMINHGISTGALFLLVGVLYDRRHTRLIEDFGGIAKPMPIFTTLFVIVTMASIGVPGTNGFVGEFLVITGTATTNRLGQFGALDAMAAALGVVLGALYMLTVVQKVFFGPVTRDENQDLPDINGRELVSVMPLVFMIFALGFFPNVLTSQASGAIARVRDDFQSRLETSPAPNYYQGPIRLLERKGDATPLADNSKP